MNVTVFNYDSSAVTFQVLDPGVRKYLQYIDGFDARIQHDDERWS
jgi:hypothetical protein